MAKPKTGGLGRGLNSLFGNGTSDSNTTRSTDRERIVYDANEDLDYSDQDAQLSGKIGTVSQIRNAGNTNSSPVNYSNETQETQQTHHSKPTAEEIEKQTRENILKEANVSRETLNQPDHQNQVQKPENNNKSELNETPSSVKTKEQPEEVTPNKEEKNNNSGVMEVDIEEISPNPDQPRSNFQEDELEELSHSIEKDGLIQPILVRETDDGKYQIIAGERRWQASKLAGIKKIPIQIKNVDDGKALELALIENIQRSDLNPIEEAYGYKRLMESQKMSQADIAQAVSKGRSTIANALRLLELPEDTQQLLFENKITAGHARAILSVPTKEAKEILTKKIVENKMNVRETEALARLMANKPNKNNIKKEPVPSSYKAVAKTLKELLGTNVKVKSSKGKNKIEIEFKDERDLERIFEEMTAGIEE